MSLKRIISHTVIIGSLLAATPAGAVNKHINSPGRAISNVSPTNTKSFHTPIKHPRWYEPIWKLGKEPTKVFTCIIYRESRSTWLHPKTNDGSYGQYGIFQINWFANIWQKYVEPVLHITLQRANAYQQATGAALIFRVDGYFPWKFDGCPQAFGYFYR